MVKIVEKGCRDCTVTLDGTECAVEFPANYRVFSAKNMTDGDIIMSVESGKTAADDGVRIVEAGGVGALNHMRSDINTVYITGTGKVQISAGNEAVFPFKAAEKGGDTVSACGNPVQLSGLQGGVPFAEISLSGENIIDLTNVNKGTTMSVSGDSANFSVSHNTTSGVNWTYIKCLINIKKNTMYYFSCSADDANGVPGISINKADGTAFSPSIYKWNDTKFNMSFYSGDNEQIIIRLYDNASSTLLTNASVTYHNIMLSESKNAEYIPEIIGQEITVNANGTDYTITPDSNPYTIPNDIRQQEGLNNISVSAGELSVVGVRKNAAIKRIYDDFSLELLFDGLARADSPAVGVDFSKHSKFIVSNYLNTLSSKCDYAGTVLIERDRLESLISNASFLDVPISTQYSVQNHFSGTISNASFYAVQSMDSSAMYATRIYGIK